MNTVYTVAFSDDGFLMVCNPVRKGWEMPGGKVEDNENVKDAAKREYLEESGYDIHITAVTEMHGCYVCAAILLDKLRDGEMNSRMFGELPDDLAFSRDEYDGVIEWARSSMRS
ncbi:MAG: NUDIX domain-containing protein [Methanomassiliicoccaceae archaeon]|nr:NUDIX domain-containing protein [Methanomassiliicoccaceae archaeon]